MSRLPAGSLSRADDRVRLFRGFGDRQTAHPHPIIGTPTEVPQPRTTNVRDDMGRLYRKLSGRGCPTPGLRGLSFSPLRFGEGLNPQPNPPAPFPEREGGED